MWFATFYDRLIQYDGENFRKLSKAAGPNANGVNSIVGDKNGISSYNVEFENDKDSRSENYDMTFIDSIILNAGEFVKN